MADYRDIKGAKVQSFLADPPSLYNGQVWFNASAGRLRYNREELAASGGAWATGGSLNTVVRNNSGAGTQTAALSFCGSTGPSSTNVPSAFSPFSGPTRITSKGTESYNGSTWTQVANLGTATRNQNGSGTQTAGLCHGGNDWPPSGSLTSRTEEFNGSSWGGGGGMPIGREYHSGCGPQTAALLFGGNTSNPGSNATPQTNTSLEYNGSSWTSGGNLAGSPTTGALRNNGGGAGTSTAGLAFGGRDGAYGNTQEYDGTSWSMAANLALNVAFINSWNGNTNSSTKYWRRTK